MYVYTYVYGEHCGDICARLRIEFGFHPIFKGTGGSEWFKVRFRVSRTFFFSAVAAPPFLRATRRRSKGSCLRQTCTRLTSESVRGRTTRRETMSILQTDRETLPARLVITRRISDENNDPLFTHCLRRAHDEELTFHPRRLTRIARVVGKSGCIALRDHLIWISFSLNTLRISKLIQIERETIENEDMYFALLRNILRNSDFDNVTHVKCRG